MSTIDKIIMLLDQQKKNQKDLTDYLHLEKSVFSAWKSGKSKSYMKHLPKIADFLGTSVDHLINDLSEETLDEDLILLNRAAKSMTPENRKKLLSIAKMFFEGDFNE